MGIALYVCYMTGRGAWRHGYNI